MPIKKCHQCYRNFLPDEIERVYCSPKCRKSFNISQRKYQKKHPKETRYYIDKYSFSEEGYKSRRKSMRKYMRKYLLIPKNRIALRLRNRINRALRGIVKKANTFWLLGCTIEELKQHLENQFKGNMSWDNYGFYGWHIDHIIPCASFDLSKASEQKKCFHYTNLQPLWAEENLRKSNK